MLSLLFTINLLFHHTWEQSWSSSISFFIQVEAILLTEEEAKGPSSSPAPPLSCSKTDRAESEIWLAPGRLFPPDLVAPTDYPGKTPGQQPHPGCCPLRSLPSNGLQPLPTLPPLDFYLLSNCAKFTDIYPRLWVDTHMPLLPGTLEKPKGGSLSLFTLRTVLGALILL